MKVKLISEYIFWYGTLKIGPYILTSAVANVFPGNSAASHCKANYLDNAALDVLE